MELFQELLFTASIAVLFSFVFTKLVNLALSYDCEHDRVKPLVNFVVEESRFEEQPSILEDEVSAAPPRGDLGQRLSQETEAFGDGCDIDFGIDDWEGIQRSELEKVFAAAVNFVNIEAPTDMLRSEISLQLYALQKVAMEGPCYGHKPIALLVSARAKWDAWQNLGSMNQNDAMEQYVRILSDNVPGWMSEKSVKPESSVADLLGKCSDIPVASNEASN